MIKLTYDSRDKIFSQRFGQSFEFPKEVNFDTNFPDEVQPPGDVKCTCYTTCDIAEDQKNIEFDLGSFVDLWNRIPQFANGANPRDVLGEAVKNGLLPTGAQERMKAWKSYWRADLGSSDSFDNVRSTMMMIKCSIGVGTFWYQEWMNSDILPVGKNAGFGHMYAIEGWKEINGKPHFIIEAWIGKKLYMPRETFNEAMKAYGMQTWVLSTAEMDYKRERTILETIKDALINVAIKLKELLVLKKTLETPKPTPLPIINEPIMETNREKFLKVCLEALDTDVTPSDKTIDELACSESLSTLLKKVFPDFPILPLTNDLYTKLKSDKRFKAVLEPGKGRIIISPRIGATPGHVGVWITEEKIASNTSKDGIWRGNYTYPEWIKEFRDKRKERIYIFDFNE
jgi:hypothetical protein